MRWLQLRFDYDSTAVRLLIKVIKVIVTRQTASWPASCSQSRWPIYLFRPQCCSHTHTHTHTHTQEAYRPNVGRRMVVARSNSNRIEVEWKL